MRNYEKKPNFAHHKLFDKKPDIPIDVLAKELSLQYEHYIASGQYIKPKSIKPKLEVIPESNIEKNRLEEFHKSYSDLPIFPLHNMDNVEIDILDNQNIEYNKTLKLK